MLTFIDSWGYRAFFGSQVFFDLFQKILVKAGCWGLSRRAGWFYFFG
jgi:hypothetical protein